MAILNMQEFAALVMPLLLPLAALLTKDPDNPWKQMTNGQRDWVRRRDDHQCQYPIWNPATQSFRRCGRAGTVHVHHILPKRAFWFWTRNTQNPHTPDNLITLCVTCHEKIHPDMHRANRSHNRSEAWQRTSEIRELKITNGKPYWNTDTDLLLKEIAEKRSADYIAKHPEDPFPESKKKGEK